MFYVGLLCLSVIVACVSSTLLICVRKWRLNDTYQIYRAKWMPAEFCFFCAGFWFSGLQVAALAIFIPNIFYIVVPFIAAPMANILYEKNRIT
jgi:hypothetical protein